MDYHLIIIGAGAAGTDAALFAARAGIKTLLVEKDELGGTSYHRGCYAMRALQACASASKTAERSEKFGIGIEFFDTGWAEWSRVRHRVTSRLTTQLGQDLTAAGIIVDYGVASFIDNHQIQISDASGKRKTLTAENFIIATGSKPLYPGGTSPVPLRESHQSTQHHNTFNSDQVLEHEGIPTHILIVGAGYIGVEFASIYRALGSKVTLIEEKERVLPTWDPLAGQKVAEQLINDGVTIHVNQPFNPNNILRDTDLILMATGRRANMEGLGLEHIGVKTAKFIEVTNQMQVYSEEFSNIFAIGDVNGLALLDSVAFTQARVAIQNILDKHTTFNMQVIPKSIYTNPRIATVGFTHTDGYHFNEPIETIIDEVDAITDDTRSVIEPEKTTIKLLYQPESNQLLGCLAIGPSATEIVNDTSMALYTGANIQKMLNVATVHPSPSEYFIRTLQKRFDPTLSRSVTSA
ncbi:MAG: NAD(P)/FAD-dependent oxidoreductase [Verrucomicrobia bacterium]|nr:NAD(P)/FAD-dependent oxidoreductase [Verrucomicrobiota bacterium]